jgi:hypothetical protein
MTIHKAASMLGISFWSVQSILKDNLNMGQIAAQFMFCPSHSALSVPQFLAKNKKTVVPHLPTNQI